MFLNFCVYIPNALQIWTSLWWFSFWLKSIVANDTGVPNNEAHFKSDQRVIFLFVIPRHSLSSCYNGKQYLTLFLYFNSLMRTLIFTLQFQKLFRRSQKREKKSQIDLIWQGGLNGLFRWNFHITIPFLNKSTKKEKI